MLLQALTIAGLEIFSPAHAVSESSKSARGNGIGLRYGMIDLGLLLESGRLVGLLDGLFTGLSAGEVSDDGRDCGQQVFDPGGH